MKNILEQEKEQVKKIFKSVYTIKEQVLDLNKSVTDLKSTLAKQIGVKPAVINRAYSDWEALIKKKEVMDEKEQLLQEVFNQ